MSQMVTVFTTISYPQSKKSNSLEALTSRAGMSVENVSMATLLDSTI